MPLRTGNSREGCAINVNLGFEAKYWSGVFFNVSMTLLSATLVGNSCHMPTMVRVRNGTLWLSIVGYGNSLASVDK